MRFTILCTLALFGTAMATLDAQACGKRRNRDRGQNCCPNQQHVQSQCGCQGGHAYGGSLNQSGYAWQGGNVPMQYGTVMGHSTTVPMPMSTTVTPGSESKTTGNDNPSSTGTVTNAAGQLNPSTGTGIITVSGTTSSAPTYTTIPSQYGTYSMDCNSGYGHSNQVDSPRRRGLFRR